MHHVHAVPASVSQKKISDPLELEFQVIVAIVLFYFLRQGLAIYPTLTTALNSRGRPWTDVWFTQSKGLNSGPPPCEAALCPLNFIPSSFPGVLDHVCLPPA